MSFIFRNPHEVNPPERERDGLYGVQRIRLPAFLRTIWEWKEDLAVVNSWLLLFCFLQAIAIIFLGIALYLKIHEPTRMIVDLPGYVIWPKTEIFKLNENMIFSFLHEVGKALYEVSPGSYSLSTVADRVSPKVAAAFKEVYVPLAMNAANGERIVWNLREVRKYNSPKLPSYLIVAGKCDRARYKIQNGMPDVTSESIVILFYISQGRNTPMNPLGLRLEGVEEFQGAEAEKVWSYTVPIVSSPEILKKEPILPSKKRGSEK
ncbi:hypothetical protein A946_09995 [Methylacidiphilum kamchatkense Kam1]|uniref:Bacterial virulence protein VirB8 domain-containing protein n=1 Tax=Methylacidiphilum kamchatkense Kam1 TaxID=1202785 RepID=A0A0C1RSQ2_9BACT|nr:hypothetical protein [Methylacidiphilum kamchatkense]KIE57971.1 hypothetical protein A946_09995 [Methylacidiphilum kamchatkense Kam1]QDQ42404.1 hypothetical protein kam1_1176 [Methylacidiphilum kamchatkense Kam1]